MALLEFANRRGIDAIHWLLQGLPGLAAWRRGDRERGMVLFGSFASALSMAIFAWGTTLGVLMILVVFAAHVAALVDLIRRRCYVPMGRWAPWLATSVALGFCVSGPLVTMAAWLAWPGVNGDRSTDVFLINGWAYSREEPRLDDWVWYQSSPLGEGRVGRVVASKGQDVEWRDNQLKVAGRSLPLGAPFRSPASPERLRYQIPDGQLLLNPSADTGSERLSNHSGEGLIVVSRDKILGKAWAKFYPIHERRLLQ